MRRKAAFLAMAGGAAAACLGAFGLKEPHVSMHPRDAAPEGAVGGPRTWRGAGHLAHHLAEMSRLLLPLADTYLLSGIDPAFRERVMLVTALANQCSW